MLHFIQGGKIKSNSSEMKKTDIWYLISWWSLCLMLVDADVEILWSSLFMRREAILESFEIEICECLYKLSWEWLVTQWQMLWVRLGCVSDVLSRQPGQRQKLCQTCGSQSGQFVSCDSRHRANRLVTGLRWEHLEYIIVTVRQRSWMAMTSGHHGGKLRIPAIECRIK